MSASIDLSTEHSSGKLLALKKQRELSFAALLAQSLSGVIGKSGGLPWNEPADLKFFMKSTMGAWLLMGRRTWEGFGNQALPGRQSLIISRNPKLELPADVSNIHLASSIEDGLKLIPAKERVFIIGGSEIYRACFPLLDEVWLTLIKILCEGDVYFNAFAFTKASEWEIIEQRALSPRAELFRMRLRS